jgi:methionyl-tRNA formyltransferase
MGSMAQLKIALLCNNKMALPALSRLNRDGVICGIATADKDREVMSIFKQRAKEITVPYRCITHNGFATQLEQWIRDMDADVVFVMTFPWRLPASLLSIPRFGVVNFHYGLLPEMRGADPIFEAIRQGRPSAGITVHIMDEGLDTGPMVLREEVPMSPDYTYGLLCNNLARLGEKLCGDIVAMLDEGALATTVQNEAEAHYWPKVSMSEVAINWRSMDSLAIKAVVKACNPIAKGAPATINGWQIGITEVSEVNLQGDTGNILPGSIVALDIQNGLIVYCLDGKGIKLEVVYTEEGYFPGYKLAYFGIAAGMVFS